MSLGQYLLGVAGLVAIAVVLAIGAHRVRAKLLPAWTGAPARLAEVVLAVSALLLLAQLLGLAGLLTGVAIVAASLLLGWAAIALIGPGVSTPAPEPVARPAAGQAMTLIALALAFGVVMHWAIAAQVTLELGSFNGDDLINHLPFSARFAETGSITELNFVSPSYLVWLYPANSELLDAVGMVLFEGDLSAPLFNLAWLALALLAAFSFGARFGAAPQTLAGAALLLELPVLVVSQAGTTKNDLFALAFLVAAAAIAVNGSRPRGEGRPGIDPAALLIAGLAAGLAAGTKFSLIPPVAALALGLVWVAAPGSRLRSGGVFAAAALLTGGFWYLRNLFHAGNPLPWVSSLGPIDLPGLEQSFNSPPDHSVAGYLTDGAVLGDWFEPGLSAQLGPLWPLILALGAGGLALGLAQRRWPVLRAVGLAGAAAALFYLFQPNGAEGPEGRPELFAFQLRHLGPPLMLGVLIAASAGGRAEARPALRWATLGTAIVLAVFFSRRGLEFWQQPSFLAGAVAIATVLVAAPVAVAALAAGTGRRGRHRGRAAVTLAAGAAVVVVGAGWFQAREYAESRYRAESGFPASYVERFQMSPNAIPLRGVYDWAQDLRGARIGTSAALQYGLYDAELSNRVEFIGVHGPNAAFDRPRTCGEWTKAVDAGDYDYVVAAPLYGGDRSREAKWTAPNPGAELVLSHGPAKVFRILGPLVPGACGSRP